MRALFSHRLSEGNTLCHSSDSESSSSESPALSANRPMDQHRSSRRLSLPAILFIIGLLALFPSPALAATASAAGSMFVSTSGLLVDSPLIVQKIDLVAALAAMEAKIAALQLTVDQQAALLATHSSQITSLEAYDVNNTVQANQIKADASALTTRVTDAEIAAAALATRVSNAEANITAIEADVSAVESAIALLTARVDTAETSIASIELNITAILTAATALTTRVSTAESTLVDTTSVANSALLLGQQASWRLDAAETLTVSNGNTSSPLLVQTITSLRDFTGTSAIVTAVNDTILAEAALRTALTQAQANIADLTTRLSAAENLNGVSTALTTAVASHTTTLASHTAAIRSANISIGFLTTKPTLNVSLGSGTQTASTTSKNFIVKMDTAVINGTGATNSMVWSSATSQVTLYGATASDVDAGLNRRFSISATVRLTNMANVYLDWSMPNTPIFSTLSNFGSASEPSYSGSASCVVSLAPGASLTTSLNIGTVEQGTATIQSYYLTYYTISLL